VRSTALIFLLFALIFAAALRPVPGRAQSTTADAPETRTERLLAERRARADSLRAPKRGVIHGMLLKTEQKSFLYRILEWEYRGLQPAFGGIKGGGGNTAGVRYKPDFLPAAFQFRTDALYSLKRYWQTRLIAGYSDRGRAVYAFARYRHLPEQNYFGIGPESDVETEGNFRLDEGLIGALAAVQIGGSVRTGLQAAYLGNWPGQGKDDATPDALALFGEQGAPGSRSAAEYFVSGAFFEWDRRDIPLSLGSASRYSLANRRQTGLSLDANDGVYVFAEMLNFSRTSASQGPIASYLEGRLVLQEYISFRHGFQSLAFQQAVVYTEDRGSDGGIIPFYLLPSLGGTSTLRGVENDRFSGRGYVLMNAEYRWQTWHFMDLALFADAGHVLSEPARIETGSLSTSVGISARYKIGSVGSRQQTIARMDIAFSSEAVQFILTFGSFL